MSDLRIPIGAFFTLVGLILVITGFVSHATAPLGTEGTNLYSGAVMLAFGGIMLWLARRAR